MYSSLFTLNALLCLAAVARSDGVTCETSDGSPSTTNCQACLNGIDDGNCYALNTMESGCQVMESCGRCQLVGCVDDGANALTINGADVRIGAQAVFDQCQSNGRVGGYYHIDSLADANADSPCGPKPTDGPNSYINIEWVQT